MKVIILGGGGHAQVIADALLSRAHLGEKFQLIGFLDDDMSLKGKILLGAPVLGRIDELDAYQYDALIVGIGNNRIRTSIFNRLQAKEVKFLSVIHQSAVVARDVVIGDGTVVFGGVVINTGSVIGTNVIINTGATVDHHANIGAHAHIAPGVHLGGTVTIGEGTFLGIGSCVTPNRTIGSWSTIGAGAVVLNDIPSEVIAFGIPAKVKQNKLEP
jgi:sugar O-acyltransferase (sialic acid O-acetyltransferase NeuD family)